MKLRSIIRNLSDKMVAILDFGIILHKPRKLYKDNLAMNLKTFTSSAGKREIKKHFNKILLPYKKERPKIIKIEFKGIQREGIIEPSESQGRIYANYKIYIIGTDRFENYISNRINPTY